MLNAAAIGRAFEIAVAFGNAATNDLKQKTANPRAPGPAAAVMTGWPCCVLAAKGQRIACGWCLLNAFQDRTKGHRGSKCDSGP